MGERGGRRRPTVAGAFPRGERVLALVAAVLPVSDY